MGNNIYFFHHFVAFWCGAGLAAWLGWTLVKARWLRSDLLAAFRLQVGVPIGAGVLLFALLLNLWAVWGGSFVQTRVGVFAWAAWAAALPLLILAWQQRGALMERAMALREALTPYERVRLYEAYLRARPGDPQAVGGLLEEPGGLQVIGELDRQAVLFGGRRIGDVAVDALEGAEVGRVQAALASGYLAHRASLTRRLDAVLQAARERAQGAILERGAGSAQVGEQLRRVLEDAVVYPGLGVTWEVSAPEGRRLEQGSRLALKAMEQTLTEHLGRVHLPLWVDGAPAAAPPGPRWGLRLEILSVEEHHLTWQEEERVAIEAPWVMQNASRHRGLNNFRSMAPQEVTTTRRVTRRSTYPMLRGRLALVRDGVEVAAVEADSAPGWPQVQKGTLRKQGFGPARLAAGVMLDGALRGLGLHIQGEGALQGMGLLLSPSAAAPRRAVEPEGEVLEVEEIEAPEEVSV